MFASGIYIGDYAAYSGNGGDISSYAFFNEILAVYNGYSAVSGGFGIYIGDSVAYSSDGPATAIFNAITAAYNGYGSISSFGIWIGRNALQPMALEPTPVSSSRIVISPITMTRASEC